MNIINAIYNLINDPIIELKGFYEGKNRANSMGGALEEYIKDLFAGTMHLTNESVRLDRLSEVFSYLGNQNNPPDSILRGGDAIEVKKVEGKASSLALNSSYPKNKLFAHSPLITENCRQCENWQEKDILYCVGVVNSNRLNSLCMVYGVDYAADYKIYERIKDKIKQGITEIENVEFSPTKELGKVKKVDPLGITDLRIRGMWSIESPFKLFQYIYQQDKTKDFNFMCIINNEKYATFDNTYLIENCIGKIIRNAKLITLSI